MMEKIKITLIGLGIILIIYLAFGFYTVGSDEMGVVISFGKVIADRVPPGIHYCLPWPFTTVKTPKATVIKRMSIGFKLAEQVQGIPPTREERERLTGDANIITVAMMVQYTVRDPADYLFNAEGADFLLRKAGEGLLCRKIGSIPVDDLLTVGKAEVEQVMRRGLQAFMDSMEVGILVKSCNLQKVEPPSEVIESFNEVSRAKANREKTINEARTYRSELLPKARAQAQQIIQQAQARAADRVQQAKGELKRFEKLLVEYRRDPKVLRERLFWDTVQEILTKARKIIVQDETRGNGTTVRIITPQP
jgi:membrane protease subunit HflK